MTRLHVRSILLTGACSVALIACGDTDQTSSNNATTQPSTPTTSGTSAGGTTPTSGANNTQGSEDNASTSSPTGPTTSSTTQTTTPTTSGEEVTYHQDVKPLMATHCTRCHYDGGQGGLDFTDSSDISAMADLIGNSVASGRMPPGVSDPDCRPYENADVLSLSQEERATFANWIEGGKLMGEPTPDVPGPPPTSGLDDADLKMTIATPYTPSYVDAANPNNEYRCFILDPMASETFWITALHPIVDQRDIVHHVVLAKTKRGKLSAQEKSPSGVSCIDDMGLISDFGSGGGMVAGWAPGMEPVRFNQGGLRVDTDDVFVLQMHYYAAGEAQRGLDDQSGYAMVTTTERPNNELRMFPLGSTNFSIPPQSTDHTEDFSLQLPGRVTLWGVFPHMHQLGTGYHMRVQKGDQNICAVKSDSYDFNNQLSYMFEQPILISLGDQVEFSCTWDNPTQEAVGYGERTDEEMCYAFSYISIGGPNFD